ncbi:MAG: hypothetical protein LC624_12240 [Halobacteriales archaeon]|nr:hypothetical protein [Halobacteriales archaeon]
MPEPLVPRQPERKAAAIEARPHRSRVLHWTAFAGSAVSLFLLAAWLAEPTGMPRGDWVGLDLLLSAAAIAEFLTRSGLRWNARRYAVAHVFDFFAMVPALWLVHRGLPFETLWLWLFLLARGARALDRAAGDGFVRKQLLLLLGAFEEEITDRVMLRILTRVEEDLARGRFGQAVGQALLANREPVLARVRAATPIDGALGGVARLAGIDKAVEQAEARAYDAIVEVLGSAEVDRAIRDVINASFANLRAEVGTKSWRGRT